MSDEALPGTSRANTHSEGFRGTMDKIRSRTDTTAKGLAAIGTAAIGAVGYAKLADVFPYPDGVPWLVVAALFAGVCAMVVAVGFLVRRFFRAGQSVITHPDLSVAARLNELDQGEEKLLDDAYRDAAFANGANSLVDLEKQARDLESAALKSPPSEKEQANAKHRQAERLFAEVQAAQDRGATFIVRRRSTYALFGWKSLLFLGLFVSGWYSTALAADAIEGARTGEIEVAKSCAEAREKKTVVKDKLPGICGEEEETTEEEASAGKTAADGVAALATARADCRAAAEKRGESQRACASLERALKASVASTR